MRSLSRLLLPQLHGGSGGGARGAASGAASFSRPPPAFVFDIDGVLIRGRTVLPAATEAFGLVRPRHHGQSAVP